MKKRPLGIGLTLCITLSLLSAAPITANAQATYSVESALAYAAEHWNDGKGLCAEFASNVLKAGGITMKAQGRVINCLKAAEKASGLTRVPLKLTPLKNYQGTTSEMATYELDGDILAPGDLVVQWCHTHNIGPHAMICAGYDSEGYAVYYAHNGALNKKRFQLGDSLAYEHTHACDMGAYVLQVSTLDSTAAAYTPSQHVHNYNSVGKCTDCGSEYSLHYRSINKKVMVDWGTTLKARPYTDASTNRVLIQGEILSVNAEGENAFGEVWYRSGSSWVKASDVSLISDTVQQPLETSAAAAEPEKESAATSLRDLYVPGETYEEKVPTPKSEPTTTAASLPETAAAKEPETTAAKEPETTAAAKAETTAAEAAPDIQATNATKITATTVQVNGTCSYTGKRPSSVGLYFGTSQNSLTKKDSDTINHKKNPFDIWYNLSGLSPSTTYYYQLYAIVNGQEYLSSVKSFTTKAEENKSQTNNLTIKATKATKVKKNSVQVNGTCSYSGKRPSSVGLYFGTSQNAMTKKDSDTINHSKNPFDIWYNLNNLSAGTTYYYQLYAIVDGTEYLSNILSFTTSK